MSLIDQRILIAAPAEAVWSFLTNPIALVKWHKGCRQISILSTRTGGVGTRRRITDEKGRTMVEEITHWLENIGYEYTMIDGPYRSYRGRIRLQAVPEGTIANWTFEYRLRGVLAGFRNLLSYRRHAESIMAESLRQLRRLVEDSGARLDERQARFAMRAAPSVEARAARAAEVQPKPPAEQSPSDDSQAMIPREAAAEELPIQSTVAHMPGELHEPSFVAKITLQEVQGDERDKSSLVDTKPRKPKGLIEVLAGQTPPPVIAAEKTPLPQPTEEWDPGAPTVPIDLVAPPRPPEAPAETSTMTVVPALPDTFPELRPTPKEVILPKLPLKPPPADSSKPTEPPRLVDPPQPLDRSGKTYPELVHSSTFDALHTQKTPPAGVKIPPKSELSGDTPPPTSKTDTGEISIWDVFGVTPPSERTRSDLEAIIASLQTPPEANDSGGEKVDDNSFKRAILRRATAGARFVSRPAGMLRTLSRANVRYKGKKKQSTKR